jgi:UDP-glucose 4-epimerase
MNSKKNCLITGANGLVGSALLPRLLESFNVFSVVRQIPEKRHEEVNYIVADLSTEWSVNVLPGAVDVVFHLAQSENFRDFPDKAMDIFNVNTYSTLKLLDYASKINVRKFIYASSGGIYGSSDSGFTEETPIVSRDNLGFYLGTKLCSEIIAENYSSHFNVVIIRFFFVYGPEQRKTMLIPRLALNVREGKSVQLQGAEGIKINPIYVDDAAEALMKCLELPRSHKINIGGTEVLSLKSICDIIGEELGRKPNYEVTPAEPLHIFGDVSKMEKLLGRPKIPFREGVRKLIRGLNG